MVGPTPEGNSMNTGESSLHNVGKISTPSPMRTNEISDRKANRRAAEEREKHCELNADYLRSPSKEIRGGVSIVGSQEPRLWLEGLQSLAHIPAKKEFLSRHELTPSTGSD